MNSFKSEETVALPQVGRIAGGLVFDGRAFVHADVTVDGGLFGEVAPAGGAGSVESTAGDTVFDANDCYVIPGLVDIHFHGCDGADFCDGTPEALHRIARFEAARGVTSICPASMTYPFDKLAQAFANAAAFEAADGEAQLVGINMEGPYISPRRVGAQNPAYVRGADATEFARLQEAANGLVKLVDVAPEEPGNLAFIEQVSDDVCVSIAHTCASYDEASAAFEAGARNITHLYNAMPGLHHREPGVIAAGAERDDVTAEVIADGIHVHPAMVRLAFTLFGAERVVLISDTMRACGLADGVYDLGGQEVHVAGPRATLADGTLAGSVTNLMDCLRRAVQEMEIPLEDAVRAATANPARVIGAHDRGAIAAGYVADAVVLDADLQVRAVVVRGRLVA